MSQTIIFGPFLSGIVIAHFWLQAFLTPQSRQHYSSQLHIFTNQLHKNQYGTGPHHCFPMISVTFEFECNGIHSTACSSTQISEKQCLCVHACFCVFVCVAGNIAECCRTRISGKQEDIQSEDGQGRRQRNRKDFAIQQR